MSTAVYGIVDTPEYADFLVDRLRIENFAPGDVSILRADKGGVRDFAVKKQTKAPEGAATGGAIAGLAAGVLGGFIGAGMIAIPGTEALVAAGPLIAALSVGAVGVMLGGVIGALMGAGIPEYEAREYAGRVKGGGILVAIHAETEDEARRAATVLRQVGAHGIAHRAEEKVPRREAVPAVA